MTDAHETGAAGTRAAPRPSQAGFTLIELMIVIAIIAIIAAIAIPNLIESRKASNETAAIGALRSIQSAQILYRDRDMDRNDEHDFAFSIVKLVTTNLLDSTFATTVRQGYVYEVFIPGDPHFTWQCLAYPQVRGKSGDRSFFIDETGVIRSNSTGFASTEDPAIGG